jgi:ribonuclease D
MKKIIYNKYDKTEILKLPVVEFQGKIVVVYSEKETRKAVDFLLSQPILGFDTETRPSFKKGSVHKVALMQVSTPEICFLFRLNQSGMTPDIIRLLEDTTVPKIGLSLNDDILSLHRNAEFTPGLFIDLQDHMREIGIEDLSLQKLYANIFGQRISKNQRLTNWEAQILSDRQKIYAATDAWACINLYREYLRLVQTGDYVLVVIPEPALEDMNNI